MADPLIQIPFLGQIITIILAIIAIFLVLKIGKKIVMLVLNSFIGLVLLLVLNTFLMPQVKIGLWAILIAGLGGVPGVLLIAVLTQLGFNL